MILLWIQNIAGWIWAHKKTSLIIALVLTAVIYHFVSVNGLQGLLRREQQARSDQSQKAIDGAKTEVNAAANLSNQAMENLNKVKQSNLNSYSNNYNAARERYCREIGGC